MREFFTTEYAEAVEPYLKDTETGLEGKTGLGGLEGLVVKRSLTIGAERMKGLKKGFTLVEMLVVVAVLITLMSLAFRLGGIATQDDKRNRTVLKMQKLENCLSGYYAAFGTYPPVKLHGDRSYMQTTNIRGMQDVDGNEQEPNWEDEWSKEFQVKAACMAQPVACEFPYPEDNAITKLVEKKSNRFKLEAQIDKEMDSRPKSVFTAGFDNGVGSNIGRHSRNKNNADWRNTELFKFGLLSYLLPRYLVMMDCDERFFDYAQWGNNNSLPCDPFTGSRFSSWREIQQNCLTSNQKSDLARVSNIPSQAACARWIANLEGMLVTKSPVTLFGVVVSDDEPDVARNVSKDDVSKIYSPMGGGSDSTANQYILDSITIVDGWGSEFYYYSPAPYQNYVLWSAGPNMATFPVWASKEDLSSTAKSYVLGWTKDDIISLSH